MIRSKSFVVVAVSLLSLLGRFAAPTVITLAVQVVATQEAHATITRTQRIASTSAATFGAGAYTSAAFTPANSSLLVVVGCGISTADGGMEGTSLTITDNTGGGPLGWTSRAATTTSPAWSYGCRIWSVSIVTGASMTVSLDCGATSMEFYRLEIFDYVTDVGGGSVTAGGNAIGSDADGDGPASITLSASPATSSHVIGVDFTGLSSASGTITSGAGFTQINEAVMASWAVSETETRTGSTSTTVDWVDVLATGTVFGGATLAAFEIAETGGGGGGVLCNPVAGKCGPAAPPITARAANDDEFLLRASR